MSSDSLSGIIAFIIIFTIESAFPFYRHGQPRYKHGFVNLALALINALVVFLFYEGMRVIIETFGGHSFALLHRTHLPSALRIPLIIVIFDVWMYWWHRLNHEIFFLWRFHRVHHTDPAMDVTTAVRFHPIEMTFSYFLNIAIMVLLGMDLADLIIYKAISLPIILFHHSNIALPAKWDRLGQFIFVMPNMHRVHHSEIREETDSNYGSIFPFWDQLFGSFRQRKDVRSIIFGIGAFKSPKWQRLRGIILLPFKTLRKEAHL